MDVFEESFHTLLSNLAARYIDNTPETYSIERIKDESHIGKDILDLLSFIESDSSIDLVLDSCSDERFFYETRLAIGTIEYCPFAVIRNF